MNYWKHARLSAHKFGGAPEDYLPIHKFLDASKLFTFHLKHRALLHHTFGIELCVEKFGDLVTNGAGKEVLVRDIAAEHCREDLDGRVPSLYDWFGDDDALAERIAVPAMEDPRMEAFLWKPVLRCGLRSALVITASNFGCFLAEQLHGFEFSRQLAGHLHPMPDIKSLLALFRITQRWQYTPDRKAQTLINTLDHETASAQNMAE